MNQPKTRSKTGCLTCRKRKKKCDELSYPVCQNCLSKESTCVWPPRKHELFKKLEEIKYVDNDSIQGQTTKTEGKGAQNIGSRKSVRHSHHGSSNIEQIASVVASNTTVDPSGILELVSLEYPSPIHETSSYDAKYILLPSHSEQFNNLHTIRHPFPNKIVKPRIIQGNITNNRRNRYFLERIALQQNCVGNDEEANGLNKNSPISYNIGPIEHSTQSPEDVTYNLAHHRNFSPIPSSSNDLTSSTSFFSPISNSNSPFQEEDSAGTTPDSILS